MSKYLLLRSNKQTGPYSLEELREMGLKAYDLVWVEGKSAAWRYPGEVEDLKSFAPPVEEQPYDRFYKKPTQINQPLFAEPAPAAASRSSVAVTAPSRPVSQPSARPVIQFQTDEASETAARENREKRLAAAAQTVRSTPLPPREAAFSAGTQANAETGRPQNPIHAAKAPVQSSELKQSIKPFLIGFGLAAFLGIGVFIGMGINNRGVNSPKDVAQKEDGYDATHQTVYRPQKMPTVNPPVDKTDKNTGSATNPGVQTAANEPLANEKKKSRIKPKLVDSLEFVKPKAVADSNALLAVKSLARATETEQVKKDAVKNKIADYVILSGNNYSVGTFGGISALRLTISNKSLYPLDLVVVEVQYVQSNKKIFKTESVFFRNIGAGAALVEEAPKSTRGTKVQYRITLINSRELGLSYTGI